MKILNIILIAVCLALGCSFFFVNTDYKEKVDQLHKENSLLQTERVAIDKEVEILNRDFNAMKIEEAKLMSEIAQRDQEIAKSKANAERSRSELSRMKKEMEETMKNIQDLKKNPPNRTGEDLLNSLKLKTQK